MANAKVRDHGEAARSDADGAYPGLPLTLPQSRIYSVRYLYSASRGWKHFRGRHVGPAAEDVRETVKLQQLMLLAPIWRNAAKLSALSPTVQLP